MAWRGSGVVEASADLGGCFFGSRPFNVNDVIGGCGEPWPSFDVRLDMLVTPGPDVYAVLIGVDACSKNVDGRI